MFIEVSAKTGENLEGLFMGACTELMKAHDIESTQSQIRLQPKQQVTKSITGEK